MSRTNKKRGKPKKNPLASVSISVAKQVVRRNKIVTKKQYEVFVATNPDKKLPKQPSISYKNKGWTNWDEYLGTTVSRRWSSTSKYMTHEEAKLYLKQFKIKTIAEYKLRLDELNVNAPKPLPKSPHTLYARDGWSGWMVYLSMKKHTKPPRPDKKGLNLVPFQKRIKIHRPASGGISVMQFRTLEESTRLVSQLGLKDRNAFMEWRSANPDCKVPWRPEEHYADWVSWSVFLGHDKIATVLNRVSVLYIASVPGQPNNVYKVAVHDLGKSDMVVKGIKAHRVFKMDDTVRGQVMQVLNQNGKVWKGMKDVYMVENVFGLIQDMSNVLDFA